MKKCVFFLMLLLTCVGGMQAQKASKVAEKPKVVIPYLGNSSYSGGLIPKTTFDALLKQGITAKDSIGNTYKVSEFMFSYAERNLYEDSVGNLMYLTDFFAERCLGDTVNLGISRNIYYKTKPGDTAYIDNIKVIDGGKQLFTKSGMRFILTK